jgi:NADPH-dependent 2,4-dienoyl-CoA reductase/sulfur reductase-like enzyme
MAGMACASFAAQAGVRVLVVEKQSTVGGSSNYSAGMLYVLPFILFFRSQLPVLLRISQLGSPDV